MIPLVAELVLLNGDVRTMDDARPRAEAVAVVDGRVAAVGSTAEIEAWRGPSTEVLDVGGRVVLPGFVDGHVHLLEGGVELGQCSLAELDSAEAALDHIAGCAPEGGWVVGGGWQLVWFGASGPTAEALDAVVPDHPAIFWSSDGHSAWVNSAALRRARVTAATPDPAAGRIERRADGSPSGTLRESAADLVDAVVPALSASALDAGLARGVAEANRYGITTVLEAHVDAAMVGAWRRASGLTVRATLALATEDTSVRQLQRLRARVRGPLLRADTAKIFVDGVIEARTAAMLEDYVDVPGAGELAIPADRLTALVRELARAGFGVHAHAIGDRAVRVTLDAMAAARADGARVPLSVAHLEVVHPDDRARFAALDVAAVFQPLWAYEDEYVREMTLGGLSPRALPLYPIGAVARTGASVGFGSDWSVSSIDPLQAIEVAVTRRGPDGEAAPAMAPDQAVSVEQALWAYTRGAALAIGRGDDAGQIAVGMPADLVVLSGDPTAVPPDQIGDLRVTTVLFGGRPLPIGR